VEKLFKRRNRIAAIAFIVLVSIFIIVNSIDSVHVWLNMLNRYDILGTKFHSIITFGSMAEGHIPQSNNYFHDYYSNNDFKYMLANYDIAWLVCNAFPGIILASFPLLAILFSKLKKKTLAVIFATINLIIPLATAIVSFFEVFARDTLIQYGISWLVYSVSALLILINARGNIKNKKPFAGVFIALGIISFMVSCEVHPLSRSILYFVFAAGILYSANEVYYPVGKKREPVSSYKESIKLGLNNDHPCIGGLVAAFSPLLILLCAFIRWQDYIVDTLYDVSIFLLIICFLLLYSIILFIQAFIYCRLGILGFARVKNFYEKCVENDITEPLTPAKQAKMVQFANSTDIKKSPEALLALYEKGKMAVMNEADIAAEAAARAKLEAAYAEKQNAERYVGLHGKEKLRRMLIDIQPAYREFHSSGAIMYKKESDWAIAGGIASGIAGAAAGVAAAADVQRKNAEVRAYNESVKGDVERIDSWLRDNAESNNRKRAIIQSQIDKIPMLLIEEIADKEAFMDLLEISGTTKKSENGGIILNVTLKLKEPVNIMGELNAVLDGFIYAILKDQNGNTDKIPVTLPVYGVSTYTAAAQEAISLELAASDSKFTITYEPMDIWLIEKI